jgi:transposase-like protein
MAAGPAGGGEETPAPCCPFCGSDRTELLSLFGSTSLTSQYRCASCRSAFEYVKWGTLRKGDDAWTK